MDDRLHTMLKNSVWKGVAKGWIIVADMDEFLCVTEDDLRAELERGTTLLRVNGYDMIGESQTLDLTDIDLQSIDRAVRCPSEDKTICFRRESILEMHYTIGAHDCGPHGDPLVWSSNVYINKHMSALGLPFITNKMIKRYERTELMRELGVAIHYTNDNELIRSMYLGMLKESRSLSAQNSGLPTNIS